MPFASTALRARLAVLAFVGLAGCSRERHLVECFEWPAEEVCPSREDAAFYMVARSCNSLESVDGEADRGGPGGGEPATPVCCYPITEVQNTCNL